MVNSEDGKVWTTTQRPDVSNAQDGQVRTNSERDAAGGAVTTASVSAIIG